MSFVGPNAFSAPTFRTIESRLANFSPGINLREHIIDNPTTIADLQVHHGYTLRHALGSTACRARGSSHGSPRTLPQTDVVRATTRPNPAVSLDCPSTRGSEVALDSITASAETCIDSER